jgi:hypothetical protein
VIDLPNKIICYRDMRLFIHFFVEILLVKDYLNASGSLEHKQKEHFTVFPFKRLHSIVVPLKSQQAIKIKYKRRAVLDRKEKIARAKRFFLFKDSGIKHYFKKRKIGIRFTQAALDFIMHCLLGQALG